MYVNGVATFGTAVGWGLPHHHEMSGFEVLHEHRGMQASSTPTLPRRGRGQNGAVFGICSRSRVSAVGQAPPYDDGVL